MSLKRTSADRGASLRGRVLVRLRAERGDTLVEVLVAALMVALIATASLGGFSDVGKLSETQRNEEQAATLAQQDQARLRGLTITQLSSTGSGTGNTATSPFTTTIDGTAYKVVSTAAFISGSTGSSACSGSNGADEVQTTSTVTWGQSYNNGGRTPVVVHGLITPAEGGALVATVVDPTGAGLAGVIVSLSGPSAVNPVTTDSSGCVIWTGLATGSYTVSYTPPAGTWVTTGGVSPPTQTGSVTAGGTAHVPQEQIGQAASILASFTTAFNGQTAVSSESDQFVLESSGLAGSPLTSGTDSTKTNNSFAATIATANNLYPWPSSASSDDYFAWAGGCTASAAQPPAANTPAITLTGGQVNPITIQEPALIILPYSGISQQIPSYTNHEYDDNSLTFSTSTGKTWTPEVGSNSSSTYWNDYTHTEHDSSNTNATATVTLPSGTTSVSLVTKDASNEGIANISISPAVSGSTTSTSLYSSSTQYQQSTLISSNLTPTTTYTVTITVSGTKASASSGKTIAIDGIAYTTVSYTTTYSQGPLLTTAPDVTVTESDTGCGNEDWPPTQVPTLTQGALAFPGLPYGNYTVCVDDGSNHVTLSGISVKNFTTGTTAPNFDIYPGSTGYATGRCT
ncbi:MAG TPA: hypothetical protein VHX66_13740 [Solirubrobacteraceae bacterium]|jgi:type II secretory pathway pseudopilin PulG|nr:hypothetical protein [Solirubrobacteraceae bacterium]